MSFKRLSSLFLVLLLQNMFFLFAQSAYFEHLGVSDGLSHYSVYSFYQDEHGLMWIGTRDGLNLYDGRTFRVFKQIQGDSIGLFGNNIRNICGDQNGHLFMQCKSGALLFDLRTEQFFAVRHRGVSAITYGNGLFYFSVADTVFSLLPSTMQIMPLVLNLPPKGNCTALHETQEGMLYVALGTQLFVFDKKRKQRKIFDTGRVVSLYEDSRKNIWVCTHKNGLLKIDYAGNVLHFRNDPNNVKSLPDNYVRAICEDDMGNYWVGTYGGLCKFDLGMHEFTLYRKNPQWSNESGIFSIWSVSKDNQGTIWIGSYYGGINLINPKYSVYKYYGVMSSSTNSLSNPVVGPILEDASQKLWIATNGGGVNCFNPTTQKFQIYSASKRGKDMPQNAVKTLWMDEKRGNLWMGTHMGGLGKLNVTTKRVTFFLHDAKHSTSIPNDNVRKICHKDDKLYLATENFIGIFDLKTETCLPLQVPETMTKPRGELHDMYIDNKNRLWFSHSRDVYYIDLVTNNYQHRKLHNNVQVFCQDNKGRLLAGTDGVGLFIYDESKTNFVPYEQLNALLPSQNIIGVQQSPSGYLYVSTTKGVLVVDTDCNLVTLLTAESGFPLNAINENSVFVSKNNIVYVGGTNGMASFKEKDLSVVHADYDINLTSLQINNKPVPLTKQGVLEYSLPYVTELNLKPQHTTFTISFASTNYIKVLKTKLEYQLSGFDKEWIEANAAQTITYTNLNPGTYTLKIRGKELMTQDAPPEKQWTIRVLPPFYKTIWAYLLYAVIICVIVVWVSLFYKSRIQLRTSLEYEKREKKQIEETNNSKLRFFTNISHEFRTPLTLITAQLDSILQMANVSQSIYTKLLSITQNVNRMKRLIHELLDFRKYEQGYMQLKVSEVNLIDFLNEIYLSFKELAKARNITYTFVYKQPSVLVWFDPNQLEKVFYNLLANAFKYTTDGGIIELSVELLDYEAVVSVKDNGVGIEEEAVSRIFDRFYQAENAMQAGQGTGIGLALAKGIVELHKGKIGVNSRKNVGSCFVVKLRLGDEHFSANQKVNRQNVDSICVAENDLPDKLFFETIKHSQQQLNTSLSTILIVEDNEELLEILTDLFQPIYKVIKSKDGVDGMEKAIQMNPDIILSDVMMPLMSGIEMCSKLKSNFETAHIPIVLLTARTANDFMVQGLLTGADDYITKPFNSKLLITRCNNLVNSRKLLQKKYARQVDATPQMIATNSLDQQMLEKAIAIVEANIEDPNFDVIIFAQEMCMSRTSLYMKLNGVIGQTPSDFITNIRLKKSVYYLENEPDLSVADITYKVGFGSTSYFIKKFGKQFGVTPLQYRRAHIKND